MRYCKIDTAHRDRRQHPGAATTRCTSRRPGRRRAGVWRYSGPFPTSNTAAGGCGKTDGDGRAARRLGAEGDLHPGGRERSRRRTPIASVTAAASTCRASSAATIARVRPPGHVPAHDPRAGRRTTSSARSRSRPGLRSASASTARGTSSTRTSGSLSPPDGIGPGDDTGTVRRIHFVDGEPQAAPDHGPGPRVPRRHRSARADGADRPVARPAQVWRSPAAWHPPDVWGEQRGDSAREPALDGLRGLAVAGVLLFHGGFAWAGGGFLGVSIFFTLSGFLITSLLLVEHDADGRSRSRISLRHFWARRARRILPAALIALAFVGALRADGRRRASRPRQLPGDGLSALAQVANWRFVLGDQSYASLFSAPSPVQHFWSLAIEEQFYLVLPAAPRRHVHARRAARAAHSPSSSACSPSASAVLAAVLFTPGQDPSRVVLRHRHPRGRAPRRRAARDRAHRTGPARAPLGPHHASRPVGVGRAGRA